MANNTVSYGFLSLADLYAQRVNTVGVNKVYDAIALNTAEYNRVVSAMMSLLVQRTVVAQEQVELSGAGTLQPIGPDGNPYPTVPSGNYTVAYPLWGAGDAWGTNRVTRAFLTVQELDRFSQESQRKDKDWLIRQILGALFYGAAYNFSDVSVSRAGYKGLGTISVKPLALSSETTVLYNLRGGAAPAADSHYYAQAAAIADLTNPFPTIYTELMEHPANSGPLVTYINGAQKVAVTTLAEFVGVGSSGINYGSAVSTAQDMAGLVGPGTTLLGKLESSDIWVVEMPTIPAGYQLTVATGAEPVLAMREYDAPELQGFFPETENVDGNHWINRMLRFAGFGVRNRVGAVVSYCGTSGTYAAPSGYSTMPLPV
jgi:hypothetical protein